jgi:hypothetical protein
MDKFKPILFPRQHVMKTLDPDHTRPLDEMCTILARMKDDYMELLDNVHDPELNIEQVLDIYEKIHLIRDTPWGKIP